MSTNDDTMDKIKKFNESRTKKTPQQKSSTSFAKNIWHNFHDGDNNIRLVGSFIQVKGHFLAPNKNGWRGLCPKSAFDSTNKNKVPQMVNCADWDIETETEKKDRTCTSCALNRIAKIIVGKYKRKELTDGNDKFFDNLKMNSSPRSQVKWNIIDRDDPYVIYDETDAEGNKKEVKKLGLKISTIPLTACDDIFAMFKDYDCNVADAVGGLDIVIKKGESGGKTTYSATAAFDKVKKGIKFCALTPEEMALVPNDLKKLCGKQTEQAKILDAFHLDLRTLIDEYEEELAKGNFKIVNSSVTTALKENLGVETSAPKVVVQAPAKPSAVVSAPKKESTEAPTNVDDVDLDEGFGEFPSEEETI